MCFFRMRLTVLSFVIPAKRFEFICNCEIIERREEVMKITAANLQRKKQ